MERTTARPPKDEPGLAAELRQSLLLLTLSVGMTAAVTAAAHATLSLLG